ncbi:MAG: hypothetical protein HQ518_09300 [Rhodopirellula sp.]|nr:hypothetical protein [Rhodopirellula sp.]
MSELTRPKALSGWEQVKRDTLLPILKADATHDTEITGQYVTTNARLKEAAFETALCLGATDPIGWLESAVRDETSGYVQGAVLEMAACLRVETLPTSVLELISTERNLERSEGTDELVAHNGAIKLAKSAGTRQAFETLADFGFTYGGGVLRSVSQAVADVARQRIDSGDKDIVQTLLAKAVNHDAPKRHRDVAIASLCHLATRDLVQEDVSDDLLRLVKDTSLDNFSRCEAIEAIGFLKAGSIGSAVPILVELASNESDLGWRAIEALIRHELFTDHSEMIASRLRLQRSGSVWSLADDQPILGWQAFLVGLLYRSERDLFATAVSQIVERAKADAVFQILQSASHYGKHTPETVTDALVGRIYRRFSTGTVETVLFDSLASISSQRLVDEEWDRQWADWLPDGRVAFCNALADTQLSERSLGRAITLLTQLALDGIYAVRRAAFRAMASLDAQAFIDTCSIWAQSSMVRLRKRAAEAIAWFPMRASAPANVDDWGLSFDFERSVREIAANSGSERWERHWADEYLKIVLEVKQPTNEQLLNAYRYGRALTKLGDDATIRRLRQHVTDSPLSTNVCHWILRLIKATEDRWNKVSRNWPKPWFNWSGVVEELDGNLVLGNGKTFACSFSLWRMSQTGPSDLGEWGGAVKPSPDVNWAAFLAVGTVEVEIPGRSNAHVIISKQFTTSVEGTRLLIIHGSGHYPVEVPRGTDRTTKDRGPQTHAEEDPL